MSDEPVKKYKWIEDIKKTVFSHEFQAAYLASTAVTITLGLLKKRFSPRLIKRFPMLDVIIGRLR